MNIFEWFKEITCKKYTSELVKIKKDSDYYLNRIKILEELVARSIEIPNITITETEEFKPYENVELKDLNLVCADLIYYKLPYEKWKEILTEVYIKYQKVHPYKPEVWDCDDFALLFAGLVAYATKQAGLDKQLAFAISWSPTHAFNTFATSDKGIQVYEPQDNNIVGELGKINEPYIVKMIWFMS